MTEKATNSEKSATRIQDLDFAKMSLDELKRLDYQKIVVLSREGLEELEVNLIAAKNELRLVLDKESQEAKRRNKIRTLLNGGENKVVIKETTAIVREKIEFLVDLANYVLGILNKKEPLERKDITPESIIAILNSDAIVGDDVLERMREILQSNEFGTSYELAMGKIEERLAQNQEKEDIAAEEDFSLAETEILSSKVEEIVEGSEEKFLLEEDPEEEKEKVNLDDPKSLNHPEFIDIGLLSKQEKERFTNEVKKKIRFTLSY